MGCWNCRIGESPELGGGGSPQCWGYGMVGLWGSQDPRIGGSWKWGVPIAWGVGIIGLGGVPRSWNCGVLELWGPQTLGVFGVIELWGHGDPGIGGSWKWGSLGSRSCGVLELGGVPQRWGSQKWGGLIGVPEVKWGSRWVGAVPISDPPPPGAPHSGALWAQAAVGGGRPTRAARDPHGGLQLR